MIPNSHETSHEISKKNIDTPDKYIVHSSLLFRDCMVPNDPIIHTSIKYKDQTRIQTMQAKKGLEGSNLQKNDTMQIKKETLVSELDFNTSKELESKNDIQNMFQIDTLKTGMNYDNVIHNVERSDSALPSELKNTTPIHESHIALEDQYASQLNHINAPQLQHENHLQGNLENVSNPEWKAVVLNGQELDHFISRCAEHPFCTNVKVENTLSQGRKNMEFNLDIDQSPRTHLQAVKHNHPTEKNSQKFSIGTEEYNVNVLDNKIDNELGSIESSTQSDNVENSKTNIELLDLQDLKQDSNRIIDSTIADNRKCIHTQSNSKMASPKKRKRIIQENQVDKVKNDCTKVDHSASINTSDLLLDNFIKRKDGKVMKASNAKKDKWSNNRKETSVKDPTKDLRDGKTSKPTQSKNTGTKIRRSGADVYEQRQEKVPIGSPKQQKSISRKAIHQASETVAKISSMVQENQNLSIYTAYGQHPHLNFNILEQLIHGNDGRRTSSAVTNSYITVQVVSSSLYNSTCSLYKKHNATSSHIGLQPINDAQNRKYSQAMSLDTVGLLTYRSINGKSCAKQVPGESGIVLCVSDGCSSMQAFIQIREHDTNLGSLLGTIPTLCIIRLIRPTIRMIHGSKMIYCDNFKPVHMPVPLIGNPLFLNRNDKITFVQPIFNNIPNSSKISKEDDTPHRNIKQRESWDTFQDFFQRENLEIQRLKEIDFITHNTPFFPSKEYIFNAHDEKLLRIIESKLQGFELEYWLIKQYLNSVILFWKIQGKLYIYQYENLIVENKIEITGKPVYVGDLPMIELQDSNFASIREDLKSQSLKFIVLYTDHRYFEVNQVSRHARLNHYSNVKWTIEKSKSIPLMTFLNYVPSKLIGFICEPLPKIFCFKNSNDKLRTIQNLLDFTFYFGKQLFLIHILKSVLILEEMILILFPFIDEESRLIGGRNIFGLLRQFLLLNRLQTESYFHILPEESIQALLSIFFIDQLLPSDASINQKVQLIFDEIDLLGMQSHLRRLNPQLLQSIADHTGVKHRSLYDENLVVSILAPCFPFILSNLENDKKVRNVELLLPTNSILEENINSFIGTVLSELEDSDLHYAQISDSKDSDSDEEESTDVIYNVYPTIETVASCNIGLVVVLNNDEGFIYCLSGDGETSHYILFTQSKLEEVLHIGSLVIFTISSFGNFIRAENVHAIQNLTLPEDIVPVSNNIKKMMVAYKRYLRTFSCTPNKTLSDISPLSIAHSHSPYFIQERNPAQIVGLLLRDKFLVLDRPLSISSSETNVFYGVVVHIISNCCEIIEVTTNEKVIYYYSPSEQLNIGSTLQFQIVHIGLIAFAMNVIIAPPKKTHAAVVQELLNFKYFLQSKIESIQQARTNASTTFTHSVNDEICQAIPTSNRISKSSEVFLIDGNIVERIDSNAVSPSESRHNDNDVNCIIRMDLIENFKIEPNSSSAANQIIGTEDISNTTKLSRLNRRPIIKYTPEEMVIIRNSICMNTSEESQLFEMFCRNHVSDLWTDNIDFLDSSSDDGEDMFQIQLNPNRDVLNQEMNFDQI